MEVKRKITLLSSTPEPGELVEKIASVSYRTQRFAERQSPKMYKFVSGRQIPADQFNLEGDPEIGKPLPGYRKDDVAIAEILNPSYVNVVKFILAIGHYSLLRNVHACFLFEGITRKSALHFLRYEHCNTNMQSQKYKNQQDFEYVLPEKDDVPPGVREQIKNYMQTLQGMYVDLRRTEIDAEWSRCVYPNNIAQTMTFETNFEQYRHLFDCLCDDDYVDENQKICLEMLNLLKGEAPEFFHDFVIREDGTAYRRGAKFARNKKVNWNLQPEQKTSYGIDVPQVKKDEVEIP